MTILVPLIIGNNGLLSRSLKACLASTDYLVTSSEIASDTIHYNADMSLLDLELDWDNIHIIILTSAISNVLECERNPQLSLKINLEWPLRIAKEAQNLDIPFVCFSSEYVFDGLCDTPYTEDSQTNPTTVYGLHKSLLEDQLISNYSNHLMLRISKLADPSNSQSFLGKMITEIIDTDEYCAATDQVFSPIQLSEAASFTLIAAQYRLTGLYNLSGSKSISRYNLALKIARRYSPSTIIKPIGLCDLNLGYNIPPHLSMSSIKLSHALDVSISSGIDI